MNSFAKLPLLSLALLVLLLTTVAKAEEEHNSKRGQANKAVSASSADASSSNLSSSTKSAASLIPNGIKAGVAGGYALPWLNTSLGWYYNWNPMPNDTAGDSLQRIPMLWGIGTSSDPLDIPRLEEFKQLPVPAADYVAGFQEADFQGDGSSGVIDPWIAALAWDWYIAPHGRAGAKLVSPSCAKQSVETWMKPFLEFVQYKPDIIAVHIFVNNTAMLQNDLNHFAQYGKPMIITEFACIDYKGPTKYCDQELTSSFITEAVKIFEADDRVVGYALSDAYNGPYSHLTTASAGSKNPTLTTTGQLYQSLVSKYKNSKRHFP